MSQGLTDNLERTALAPLSFTPVLLLSSLPHSCSRVINLLAHRITNTGWSLYINDHMGAWSFQRVHTARCGTQSVCARPHLAIRRVDPSLLYQLFTCTPVQLLHPVSFLLRMIRWKNFCVVDFTSVSAAVAMFLSKNLYKMSWKLGEKPRTFDLWRDCVYYDKTASFHLE